MVRRKEGTTTILTAKILVPVALIIISVGVVEE